ncbi:uncharacterized protein LOC135372778 [Ornithodoros turicata]|uniref:uncharacterized protein LOC135372778 n=1 Tax=Ornithodoros turicata TaxID=34597 RepID=UPI0031394471
MDASYAAELDREEEVLMTVLLAYATASAATKRKKKRKWWVRPCLRERDCVGQAHNLLPGLRRANDEVYYRDFLRMPPRTFDSLLSLVGDRLRKRDTRWRKSIKPDERLAATLRFLAAGDYLCSSSFNFLIGRSTLCGIVSETCQVIWDVLSPLHVQCPRAVDDWMKVAHGFLERWNIPHCIGAMDGKHIVVQCPAKSESVDRNYKGTFSKCMFAVCDAYYRFIYVEIGHHGSQSDGGIFAQSSLLKDVVSGEANIPPASPLGNRSELPYFFVGDEAFPLKTFLMRPFPKRSITSMRQRVFNYRHSRGRRIIENAFGVLAQRWRILRRPFAAKDDNIRRIVAACIALHNFLLSESESSKACYCPTGVVDREGSEGDEVRGMWRTEEAGRPALAQFPRTGLRCTSAAHQVREHLADYFMEEGALPFQEDKAKKNWGT